MSSEREYRLEGARCLLAADQEQDPGRRIQLTKTAGAWLEARSSRADGNQRSGEVCRYFEPRQFGAVRENVTGQVMDPDPPS